MSKMFSFTHLSFKQQYFLNLTSISSVIPPSVLLKRTMDVGDVFTDTSEINIYIVMEKRETMDIVWYKVRELKGDLTLGTIWEFNSTGDIYKVVTTLYVEKMKMLFDLLNIKPKD